MSGNPFHFSPLFRRFLASYLIILLIPLIAGYASYLVSIDVAKSASIESGTKTLELSKETLESRLLEVEGFTKQLAINQDLNRLIVNPKPLDEHNVVGLGLMQRTLTNYSRTVDYLSDFFIYIKNYNVVITPSTLFYRPEHYYDSHRMGEMSYSEWCETILQTTHLNQILPLRTYSQNHVISDKQSYSAITFLQSLPINSFNNPQATIGVIIDGNKLGRTLQTIVEQYGGWALVKNAEGETIASVGLDAERKTHNIMLPTEMELHSTHSVDGELLISVRSEHNNWLYIAGIPESALMEKANKIKKFTGVFTCIALFAGLLIGLFLAYRNSAPIHRLLAVFREQGRANEVSLPNDIDFLAGNISKLITKLEADLKEQIPLLQDAFIKRLLFGEFYSQQDMEAASSQIGIKVPEGQGYVGLIKLNGYEEMQSDNMQELSVGRLLLRRLLLDEDPEVLVTDWGTDKLVVIIFDPEPAAALKLQKLLETAYNDYRLLLKAGMGSQFEQITEASYSFNEAMQALEYAIYVDADSVVHYKDAAGESAMYYYPIDIEQRLINTLKAGELEESLRILEQLYERNIGQRELSYEMMQQFMNELKGTYLKLTEQKLFYDQEVTDEIKGRIAQIQPNDSVIILEQIFYDLTKDICEDIAQKKADAKSNLAHAIIQYINNQYTDQDLTLYKVAEKMGRPEKFITQLLQEHTGFNFSEYVEQLRIDQAVERLVENKITIDEIAVQIGYNSTHSFRRAFKRVHGVSPSTFRQIKS